MSARFLTAFVAAMLSAVSAQAAVPAKLAVDGKSQLPIIVSPAATSRVQAAAASLAEYLGRISGGKFEVTTGDAQQGIAVGVAKDFPKVKLPDLANGGAPANREDYLLRSHAGGLLVVGATELAVEHAVWDLLHRLGYRQFFPGKAWEVVPQSRDLTVTVDKVEHPDYHSRRIWYGYGAWDYAKQPYDEWCLKNRARTGIVLNTGHAYDGILARNKQAFAEHPEYLGLVGGVRKSTKFCISNPGLRQLVVEDALAQLAAEPDKDSVSVDPSDGLNWCECEKCQAMGSISDRALTLANQVAAAVNEKYPGKLVGMYAYSGHSPPPSIRVHPQVVISVATAFIRGGYSVDELFAGWNRQGATLGVREYFSVNTWDRDLPGRARGSDLEYLATKIPHFHSLGARFFSAESSDNWAPNGLGYYLAARLLWDVDEAEQVDALVQDFLEKSFGPAQSTMARFYELLDRGNRPLLSDHLIGQMYRLLAEARSQTNDPAIHTRLDDLVQYLRYVELYNDYTSARGEERQAHFEQMIRHVYRMRETMMIHSKALYRDVVNRDKSVTIPAGATWGVDEDRNPWKSSEPFSQAELEGFVTAGIERHPLRGFDGVQYSRELVRPTALKLPELPTGSVGGYSRGNHVYYTWIDDPRQPIELTVTGGKIYRDRGDVGITLQAGSETDSPVDAEAAVPSDREPHQVSLRAKQAGLHQITISDAGAGTVVEWEEGLPMTVISTLDEPTNLYTRWNMYFYVPRGTKSVGGFSSGPGRLRDADGNEQHTFSSDAGYFNVPVPAGQDGRIWKFEHCAGNRMLMTVPPCLARSPAELLLPQEVIQQDQLN